MIQEEVHMIRKKLGKALALTIVASLIMQTTGVNAQADVNEETNVQDIVQSTSDDWSGYTKISSVSDLAKLRSNPSGKYVLTADIDLSEVTSPGGEWDSGNGWKPIESFSGVLDGNGYRIKGMHIFGEVSSVYVGFIGKLNGGTICNLGMTDVEIEVANLYESADLGGLVGYAYGGSSIYSCYVSGNINVTGELEMFGGILGCCKGAEINNCINMANIKYNGNFFVDIGGICGYIYDGDVTKCYNIGKIESDSERGSIRAIAWGGSSECYYLKDSVSSNSSDKEVLTDAQMKVADSFVGFDFDNVWEMEVNGTYKYPQLKSARIDRIAGVEIANLPTKTEYYQGETLDLTGGTVKITYQDSVATPVEVVLTDDMIDKTSYDMSSVGTQNVKISYGGIELEYQILVKEIPVTSVSFDSYAIDLIKGEQKSISAKVLPDNATNKELVYSSSDTGVASVNSSTGMVSGVSKGTATITAKAANGISATYTVTVKVPATNLILNKTELEMTKGKTEKLTATLSPTDSDDSVTWSSSNNNIASVDQYGNVTAKGVGKVTITAKANSSVSKMCNITITQDIEEFSCKGITEQYYTGDEIEQDIEVTDGQTILVKDVDYTVEYSDNIDAGTATVIIEGKGYYTGSIVKSFEIKLRKYTVKFVSDGKVVKTQKVEEGNSAKAPSVKKKGYVFGSWSKRFTKVHSDVTAIAKWTKVKVSRSAISSAQNTNGKKIKIKFKKITGAAGYEIRYSLKLGMTGSKTINSTKTTATISKLAKGKIYYIQVRAYKKDSIGAKVYSEWSKQQKVKVEK